jgi:hypothetical protein
MADRADRKDVPSLVAAAMALDDELRAFDEIARQAKEQRMNSQKTLARTAAVLTASVEARERIEAGVRRLVTEIGGAQERQQRSVQALVEVAAELERRTRDRELLLARFAGLGTSAARVNTLAADLASRRRENANDGAGNGANTNGNDGAGNGASENASENANDGANQTEILELLRAIQDEMSAVATEADTLATDAEKDGWPEIARQADAVRQQVNAVKSKLAAAHRTLSANAPS